MKSEKIYANLEIFKARAAKMGYPFKREIQILIDLRGLAAGCARGYTVRLNQDLLETNEHEIAYETLGHELAHVLQFEYAPNSRPHGKEFKFFATLLGVSTSTTHKMEVKPTRVYKKFDYFCGCAEKHSVTTIIHNRILKGRVYTCKICKQDLKNEIIRTA